MNANERENLHNQTNFVIDGGFINIVIMAQFWFKLDRVSESLKARTKVRLQQNHIKPNF